MPCTSMHDRYIKKTTGESIIPYLYIGPLLYLVPYGTFWTWENDVVPVRYVDERLEDLLNKFQSRFRPLMYLPSTYPN